MVLKIIFYAHGPTVTVDPLKLSAEILSDLEVLVDGAQKVYRGLEGSPTHKSQISVLYRLIMFETARQGT